MPLFDLLILKYNFYLYNVKKKEKAKQSNSVHTEQTSSSVPTLPGIHQSESETSQVENEHDMRSKLIAQAVKARESLRNLPGFHH